MFYGEKQALSQVNLDVFEKQVTSLIGPSGCGKSTFLRCINRMNDLIPICRFEGDLEIDGQDIYHPTVNVVALRAQVGMVFQKPNPFPKSIKENVAYGLKIHGLTNSKSSLDDRIEWSLKAAGLWDEVSDSLDEPVLSLSGVSNSDYVLLEQLRSKPV